MKTIGIGIVYAGGPLLLLFACKKWAWLNKFGTVGLAYVFGIFLGNTGLITPDVKPMQDALTSVTIALAIPLLLFSINIKQWSRLALKTSLALLLGIFSVMLIIAFGNELLRDKIPECWKVSGLMVGVYIGATANMAAIMKALNVDPDTFVLVNAYDILICIAYFFFLITKAQSLIGRVLPPFKPMDTTLHPGHKVDDFDGWDAYRDIHRKEVWGPLAAAVLLSGAISGIAFMFGNLFAEDFKAAGMILCITALSILMSLVPFVNRIRKTFQSGMYLVVIFCIIVGSMADFSIFTVRSLYIGAFIALVIIGSITLQVLFSRLFRIDTDTTIIASTAFIFSAPFVPSVANALHNKEIILSGITIGIIGYATGNFLGITLAYFLK